MMTPDLPQEIWLEIFQFATYVHESTTLEPLDPFTKKSISTNALGPNTPTLSLKAKCTIVLVCRDWRRIGAQLLYQHVIIRSPRKAFQVLYAFDSRSYPPSSASLFRNSEYGRFIRHLEIYTFARGCGTPQFFGMLLRVFQYCPNLRTLTGSWREEGVPLTFLSGIQRLYSPSLEELSWRQDRSGDVDVSFLESFSVLRVLDLSGCEMNEMGEGNKKVVLSSVESLIVYPTSRCLKPASGMSFPRLKTLTVKTDSSQGSMPLDLMTEFLNTNGASVTLVNLLVSPTCNSSTSSLGSGTSHATGHVGPDVFLSPGTCPMLETLSFPVTAPPFRITEPHTSLRRVGIHSIKPDWFLPDKASCLRKHLKSFVKDGMYPNLQTVRTVDFLVDMDGDQTKDAFIWWTERFEREGIDFQDGEGVCWAYYDQEESDDETIVVGTEKK